MNKQKITKLLVIIGTCLLVFIAVKIIVQYLNSGSLIVKTNGDGNVTIVVKDSDGKEVVNSQANEVSKQLYKGEYVIEAFTSDGSKSRASATVVARKNTEQYLGIVGTLSPLLASRVPAYEINEAEGGAYFLQANSRLIKKYDEKSLSQPVIKTDLQRVSKIDLDKNGKGYVMVSDNLIYSVNNNKTTNIRDTLLSNVKNLGTPRDIDYNPDSGELFVSAGQDVYRVAKGGTKAEHISTAPWLITKIAYNGNGRLMLSQYPEEYDSEDEDDDNPISDYYSVSLLDTQAKQLSEIDKQLIVRSADWSPSGRYLAYNVGSSLRIYDSSNNSYLDDIFLDNKILSSANWCTDDKLIFSDGSGVWSSAINKERYSALLAKLPDISALSCNSQESIYAGTYKQPRSGGLYRLSGLDRSYKDLVNNLYSATPHFGCRMMLDYVQTGDK